MDNNKVTRHTRSDTSGDESVRITLLDKIWPQSGDRDWSSLIRTDEFFDALGSALRQDLMAAFGGDELALVLDWWRSDVDSVPFTFSGDRDR